MISFFELDRRIREFNNDLVIVENKLDQQVYRNRVQGRQVCLQTEVIRLDLEQEFGKIHSQISKMSIKTKKRLSIMFSQTNHNIVDQLTFL